MDEKNNKNQNQGQNNKDGNKGNKFNQTLLILLIAVVITVLAISCVNTFLNNSTSQEISYTDFINMLENGNVSKVVYDQDVIRITPKTQPIEGLKLTYYTGYIYDEDVIQYMKDNNVEYNVKIQDKSSSILDFLLVYIVPWVLIYFIFSFVFRKMSGGGGMMGVGKSNAKMYGMEVEKIKSLIAEDLLKADLLKEKVVKFVVDNAKALKPGKKAAAKKAPAKKAAAKKTDDAEAAEKKPAAKKAPAKKAAAKKDEGEAEKKAPAKKPAAKKTAAKKADDAEAAEKKPAKKAPAKKKAEDAE